MQGVRKPIHLYCLCSYACLGLRVTCPPIQPGKHSVCCKFINSFLSLFFKIQQQQLQRNTPIKSAFVGGISNQSSVRFYWLSPIAANCHWILERCTQQIPWDFREKLKNKCEIGNCLPGVMCMNPDIRRLGLILTVPQFIRNPSHNGAFLLSRPKMHVRNAVTDDRVTAQLI